MKDSVVQSVVQAVVTIAAGVVVWYLTEYQSQPLKNVENLNFTAPVTPSFDLKSDKLADLVRAEEARLKEIQSQRMAEELRISVLQRQQQLEQQHQVEQARLLVLQQQREAEEARLEALKQQQQRQIFEPEMVDIPATTVNSAYFAAPSFDCYKASKVVEHTICDNPELAQADGTMGAIYNNLRNHMSVGNSKNLQKKQRQWIKQRNQYCDSYDSKCLLKMTNERIYELKVKLQAEGIN